MTEQNRALGKKKAQATLATRVLIIAVILLLATVIGLQLTTTLLVRGTQQTNTKKTDSSFQTLKLIKSCTTPGQPCYERGQQQTAGAVANINKVVILASACSIGLSGDLSVEHRQTLIESCVIQRLAADAPKP
jgi:archaellum component FlaG (FlaF/FlaG flagellin family)